MPHNPKRQRLRSCGISKNEAGVHLGAAGVGAIREAGRRAAHSEALRRSQRHAPVGKGLDIQARWRVAPSYQFQTELSPNSDSGALEGMQCHARILWV